MSSLMYSAFLMKAGSLLSAHLYIYTTRFSVMVMSTGQYFLMMGSLRRFLANLMRWISSRSLVR